MSSLPWFCRDGLHPILLSAAILAAGCAGAPEQAPETKIALTLRASQEVNPDTSGRPSPISVRIHTLKGTSEFERADFFQLYNDPNAALGSDVIAIEGVQMRPSETRDLELKPDPQARYLGILAAYRDIDRSRWRVVHPIASGQTQELLVELSKRRIEVKEAADRD